MPAPTPAAAVSEYFSYDLYVIARLSADPATAGHVPLVEVPHLALAQKVATRNQADDAVRKALAKRDYERDRLSDLLEPFALQVAAHHGSKSAPGYLALFPLTPAQLATLPLKDLPKALANLQAAIAEAGTPKEVKAFAKPVLEQIALLDKAQAALDGANTQLKKAGEAVAAAKDQVLTGIAKLRAALQSQFPRQPKRVARYLPVKNGKKPVKGAVPPAPDAPA